MRRPPGLRTEKAKRLFDQLVLELEADTTADREQVALAVRYRMRSDALLDADRLTAANEAGRRADAILRQLRRRPITPPNPNESPRLRSTRATLTDHIIDLTTSADEDVAHLARLIELRGGHWNGLTDDERAWAEGRTTTRPERPSAA